MSEGCLPPALVALAAEVLDTARAGGLRVATAESCTGGLVVGALTETPGSGDVVDRGFITYSNGAKAELLGVPPELLALHGAVSEPVARAMAEGALARADAEVAVAITGIAGPSGGSADKPVGLVHFAVAQEGLQTVAAEERFGDRGRGPIRLASVDKALRMLLDAVRRG